MNYHKKRECKKPIDGVWSKALGESCEWKCPGRSGVESYSVPKFKTTKNAYACSKRTYTYDKTKKAFSGGNRKLVPGRAYSCRSQSGGEFLVEIQVISTNERGVLSKVAGVISSFSCNIENVRFNEVEIPYASICFSIKVTSRDHVAEVIKELRKLPDINKVVRT